MYCEAYEALPLEAHDLRNPLFSNLGAFHQPVYIISIFRFQLTISSGCIALFVKCLVFHLIRFICYRHRQIPSLFQFFIFPQFFLKREVASVTKLQPKQRHSFIFEDHSNPLGKSSKVTPTLPKNGSRVCQGWAVDEH